MKNVDVLVIGGSAAGMVAALTGKVYWNDKSFMLVKKQKDVMVPCGIPYIFGTLEGSEKNLMPVDVMMEKNNIVSAVDEAMSINTNEKVVSFKSGDNVII
jgi:NADH oxidase (H2O2-forming)